MTRIVDKTDPEIMNKVVDRSEQETEEALRTVGQTISKQMPSISRDATKKILNELKNVMQERRDRRKTGRNEEGQVDGEREERREEGDAVKNDQWYDVLDFGNHYGKPYRCIYSVDNTANGSTRWTRRRRI